MNKKVLVLLPVEKQHKQLLESAAPDAFFTYSLPSEVTAEMTQSANVIIGNVPASYIHSSSNLELLQLHSAGTDDYIVDGVLHPNTVLTNATGAYGQAVAEHTFSMALALKKKLHLYRDDQAHGCWTDHGNISSLRNAKILVLGLGDIGLYFARLCKAMGSYTIGIKRRPSECPEGVDELYTMDKMNEMIPTADVIASFLPQTKDTIGIFDKEFFASMKNTAIFLNAGRGSAVDQEALLSALNNNQIYGAGLDVTTPEPLPTDHPLWKQKNCIITPHISGHFHLQETFERIVEIAVRNLKHYSNGEEFENIIDFSTGYKR